MELANNFHNVQSEKLMKSRITHLCQILHPSLRDIALAKTSQSYEA